MRSFTVDADDADIRLDRWFKRHLPEVSFNTVSRWSRTGEVRLDGRKTEPGERLAAGQTITVPPAEAALAPAAGETPRRPLSAAEVEYAQSLVIHRDKAAIVLNKPPGLATQGGTGTTTHVDGLLDGLCFGFPGRPKLVHRLDKDTSGVLLLARTARAAAFFSKAFSGRTARKAYWALVVGRPEPDAGEIDAALAKQPGSGGEKMHVDPATGQKAVTRYRVLDHAADRAAWVEFQPLTGRTHQIRVHAAAIGHPIVGDAKYGGRDAFLTGGISRKMHLHARRLVIEHPDSGMLDIAADLPPHMAESFAMLGFDPADGDVPFDDAPDLAAEARAVAAAAKARRKAHRGERRNRGRG
ncbi:MAG: RluA family pseudouridine synthase [Sphingomonadaceae bacterium]|nr:RluA family pseudouridine synthase [Sphingomonadaceae bacterium]